jgi:hypothetical protein
MRRTDQPNRPSARSGVCRQPRRCSGRVGTPRSSSVSTPRLWGIHRGTSDTANRPPGLSTRNASAMTRSLSADSSITQFEMITSTELSGRGMRSISPFRNSTLMRPISLGSRGRVQILPSCRGLMPWLSRPHASGCRAAVRALSSRRFRLGVLHPKRRHRTRRRISVVGDALDRL